MNQSRVLDIEREVARMRVLLSVAVIISIYVDPSPPMLARWGSPKSGLFVIDPFALAVLCAHLSYGSAVSWMLERHRPLPADFHLRCAIADVGFAAAIAHFTDGTTSVSFVFFLFAVLGAGLRGDLRQAFWLTAASVAAYAALILLSHPDTAYLFAMRPVYLAIMGYLTVHLAHQRVGFEVQLREWQAVAERQRVATSLHDGYVQALAGVVLRLETSRELLRRQQPEAAFAEISELQASVKREHTNVRTFLRSLLGLGPAPVAADSTGSTILALQIDISAAAPIAEQVLQIALEGLRNVARHAHATTGKIAAFRDGTGEIKIHIIDDGVGFAQEASQPWSIVSRVKEMGGRIHVGDGAPGAAIRIEIPAQCP